MSRLPTVAGALGALIALAAPAGAAAATPAHPLHMAGAVVAADGGNAVVAGVQRGRVVLARLDGAGRPLARRLLGRARSPTGVSVALVGRNVAVSWLDDNGAIVLARTGLDGKRVRRQRLGGSRIRSHELAMNKNGVVVDVLTSGPDPNNSGISALVSRPGHRLRHFTLAPIVTRTVSAPQVDADRAGRFNVTWTTEGLGPFDLLGAADADATGDFGPLGGEQDMGTTLFALTVGTAANGDQVAVYQRPSGDGRVLLVTTHRTFGGRWHVPRVIADLGSGLVGHQFAVAPNGDALVAYAELGLSGVIRGVLLGYPADAPRLFEIGRGLLEGVTADAAGRARVLWSRSDRLQSATVDLSSAAVGPARLAVAGCAGGRNDSRRGRLAGDARGRVAVVIACGAARRPSVAHLRTP